MPIPLNNYAQWVRGEVFMRTPSDSMRVHSAGWRTVLGNIFRVSGVFESASLVISRWEFLGGLYEGQTAKTGVREATSYAREFLPAYNHLHNLHGDPNFSPDQSDLFAMLRNKPLHGFTPAGVATVGLQDVVGWSIGQTPCHLALGPSGVSVDCLRLVEDLCDSMLDFATYLDANTDVIPNRLPQDRWIRGFWARFCPKYLGAQDWMTLGEQSHGVPI